MAKVERKDSENYHEKGWMFYCPGCREHHFLDDRWKFENNDVENPTFSPSLLIKTPAGFIPVMVCHSFIRDGKIEFLADCTHKLSGKTIEMEDL